MLASVTLAMALGGGTGELGPPPVSRSATRIERAVVRSNSTGYEGLADAMRARMAGIELFPYEAESFAAVEGSEFAYVEVTGEADPGAPMTLTVVLTDGRAYVREFVADPDDRVRSIAAVVANTLAGIEQEEALPTRTGEAIPVPEEPESAEAAVPVPVPVPAPERVPAEPSPDPVDVPPPPRTHLGLAVHVGALLTLTPAFTPAAATGLTVSGAFPRGLVVEGELRWAGASARGFVLSRVRLAARVGYRFRHRRFELVATAGPSVEPWLVTERGSLEAARRPGGTGATAPLIGGLATVSPGALFEFTNAALRIGGRIDFAGSVLPSGRVGSIRRDSPTVTLFTFGGPELMVGLSAALWL